MIALARDLRGFVVQLFDPPLDPGQHPAAGHVDGTRRISPSSAATSAGGRSYDGRLPEGVPGRRCKLALHVGGGRLKELTFVFVIEKSGRGRVDGRLGFEQLLHAGCPAAASCLRPPGQEVDHQVACNPRKPPAEAAAAWLPPIDRAGHGPKHVLAEVFRVGILQAPCGEPADKSAARKVPQTRSTRPNRPGREA